MRVAFKTLRNFICHIPLAETGFKTVRNATAFCLLECSLRFNVFFSRAALSTIYDYIFMKQRSQYDTFYSNIFFINGQIINLLARVTEVCSICRDFFILYFISAFVCDECC